MLGQVAAQLLCAAQQDLLHARPPQQLLQAAQGRGPGTSGQLQGPTAGQTGVSLALMLSEAQLTQQADAQAKACLLAGCTTADRA